MQVGYLRSYLADLGASSILEECVYFDRDYLAEFSAFYAASVRGHANRCRRLHFFSGPTLTWPELEKALGGDATTQRALQEKYLGFCVLRPIENAPLGRTVLRWYEEHSPQLPRITKPSREYSCHVAGLKLKVEGLAWQQQDQGVSACATIALWTMFHASAFDDHHAIPTTAQITRAAGDLATPRIFPTTGLNNIQLLQAIKSCGLAPIVLTGDSDDKIGSESCFSVKRFSSSCAAFVRSGYPVLIGGQLKDHGKHAVCVVGFRETAAPLASPGSGALQDEGIKHFYLHDDNIGPSARFKLVEENAHAVLVRDPPKTKASSPDPSASYPSLTPTLLIAAVNDDLRSHPDSLHKEALSVARGLISSTGGKAGLSIASRFISVRDYLGSELARILGADPALLARVRRDIVDKLPPMSLHVGLVRFGFTGNPVLDVLYDTSGTDKHPHAFGHLGYLREALALAQGLSASKAKNLGASIVAY